jgi:hypothetical protein
MSAFRDNLAGRWFAGLAVREIRRGARRCRRSEADIRRWIYDWSTEPGPSNHSRTADGTLGTYTSRCQ